MAPKPHPRPTAKEIAAHAGKYPSRAKLSHALGLKPPTVNKWCDQDPEFRALMDGALAKPVRTAQDIEEGVATEEVLAQRLNELERAERARRKIDVFEERVLLAFDQAIEAREPSYSPRVIPKSQRSASKHEFVLLWSDTHAGEVVSEVETNGLNHYDWNVMMKRHDRIREAVFSYADNRPYPVSKLHVCGLGDALSGDIHDELVETNEMPLAEATIQFAMDAATWLESFLEHFADISFSGVVGNHPRAKRKPQAKQAFNNADWLMYHAMRSYLRNQSAINWDIPKASAHPITVAEKWRCLLLHGDGIRSSMPGVPWGGVMRRVTALDQQYAAKGLPINHYFLGHFHQGNVVQQGRVVMNGSVKGIDEYSLKAFGGGGDPQQLLLTFHPRNGLTDVSFIDCG